MLTFEENLTISAMISAEQEEVALIRKIDPNSANVSIFQIFQIHSTNAFSVQGLVELWLKDVETTMLESIHEQMKLAWESYYKTPRINWVLNWPGQVVAGISCMVWTYEVSRRLHLEIHSKNE